MTLALAYDIDEIADKGLIAADAKVRKDLRLWLRSLHERSK